MMWKVPFRQVYCDKFKDVLLGTLWCHVVIKAFPYVYDLGHDALLESYVDNPDGLYQQLEHVIRKAHREKFKLTEDEYEVFHILKS